MSDGRSSQSQVRTIPELLAAAPDVDVRGTWTAIWGLLEGFKDRLLAAYPVLRHPSSSGFEEYTAGGFEGSLSTWSGPVMEWFVHSWIGNRGASILDMNITVWLDQSIDAPHLVIVGGTVPSLYTYSDLIPRRDLAVDADYLARYYEPENEPYLRMRGDDRFTPAVSHGSYMRALASPVCHSYTAERTSENTAALLDYLTERFERWLATVATADAVPDSDRVALRARDHRLRRLAYDLDPMNALAAAHMGTETMTDLVSRRSGREQMAGQ